MDKYTMEEMKFKNGYDRGMQAADAHNRPQSPYEDDNILKCPRCGSGEYLTNEDGNTNLFCGQRGQALEWGEDDG